MESSNRVRSLLTGLLVVSIPVACEANATEIEARGKAILQEKCGRCHAVEAALESPLKNAPTMRDIYVRYVPRELQEELLQGMVSKHKAMPQIEFSQEEVAAIMAYLYALSVKK